MTRYVPGTRSNRGRPRDGPVLIVHVTRLVIHYQHVGRQGKRRGIPAVNQRVVRNGKVVLHRVGGIPVQIRVVIVSCFSLLSNKAHHKFSKLKIVKKKLKGG